MNEDAISLDRLNDIVMPLDVSIWPLAPGWYVLMAVAVILLSLLGYRALKQWQANAYRRRALHELSSAQTVPAIAEILRRTALAYTSREAIAAMSGCAWVDWLEQQYGEPLPDAIRTLLADGVYRSSVGRESVQVLRDFAADWIAQHSSPQQNGVQI